MMNTYRTKYSVKLRPEARQIKLQVSRTACGQHKRSPIEHRYVRQGRQPPADTVDQATHPEDVQPMV